MALEEQLHWALASSIRQTLYIAARSTDRRPGEDEDRTHSSGYGRSVARDFFLLTRFGCLRWRCTGAMNWRLIGSNKRARADSAGVLVAYSVNGSLRSISEAMESGHIT